LPADIASQSAFEHAGPHLSIVVPAYNESARIGSTLPRMVQYLEAQPYTWELLVVDDGSTDATQDVVRQAAAGHPSVRVLEYGANRGKGYAVRFGMLEAAGDFVLFSDADLSTPLPEVEKLFAATTAGADVAIGSRDVADSHLTRRQSALRELAGKTFNRLVQTLAVPGIHDTQCGFKLFTRSAAQNVFSRCQVDNFSFDVEALYLARLLGYVVAEVGVEWEHCDGSKLNPLRDALRMFATLFRIRATDYQIKRVQLPSRSAPK